MMGMPRTYRGQKYQLRHLRFGWIVLQYSEPMARPLMYTKSESWQEAEKKFKQVVDTTKSITDELVNEQKESKQ